MSGTPDISVVIPTHNRRDRLERAVASCFRGNDDVEVEVNVVDDGSEDGTQDWGRSLSDERIHYRRQDNQGAPVARNRGLEMATGDYVKFLDDDDWLVAGGLSREVNALRAHEASISYGGFEIHSDDGETRTFTPSEPQDLISGLMRGTVWSHPVALTYRRDVLRSLRWNPTLEYHQDKDFAIRAASQGVSSIQVEEVVGIFSNHGGERISTTSKKRASTAELIRHRVSSILMGIDRLEELGELRPHHQQAAAEGLWRCAYMASPYDPDLFRAVYKELRRIQPDFSPNRRWRVLEVLDTVGSPIITEDLLRPIRKGLLK
jgi:glycosyltransferase involved in cell wall biosynthesis